MKKLLLLLVLAVSGVQLVEAQCKFKSVPVKLRRYCVSTNTPKPALNTKMRVFFDKYYFIGQASFARDAGNAFLYLHLARNFSKRFELLKTNALELTTESGKMVKLFPVADFSGKNMMSWFAVGCYYGLTTEQLQILANEKVKRFRLYLHSETGIATTEDDANNGWHKDENGNTFFNHTIEAETKKENFRRSANCLFNKK